MSRLVWEEFYRKGQLQKQGFALILETVQARYREGLEAQTGQYRAQIKWLRDMLATKLDGTRSAFRVEHEARELLHRALLNELRVRLEERMDKERDDLTASYEAKLAAVRPSARKVSHSANLNVQDFPKR